MRRGGGHALERDRKKCERCWHWRDDVGRDPEHPGRSAAAAPTTCSARAKRARRPDHAWFGSEVFRRFLAAALAGIALAVIVILLDQFTKTLILGGFQLGDSRTVTRSSTSCARTTPARRFLPSPGPRAGSAGSSSAWAAAAAGSSSSGCCAAMAASACCLGAGADPRRRASATWSTVLHGHVIDFIQLHYGGWCLSVVQHRRQRDHHGRGAADRSTSCARGALSDGRGSGGRRSHRKGLLMSVAGRVAVAGKAWTRDGTAGRAITWNSPNTTLN